MSQVSEILKKDKVSHVSDILKKVQEKIGADDVRFRLVDWEDRAVVPIADWIIGGELQKDKLELAKRVYFDRENPKRIDCIVGLVGRIARTWQEIDMEEDNSPLLQKLKKLPKEVNIGQKIGEQKKLFPKVKEEPAFKQFLKTVKVEQNKNEELQSKLQKYYTDLSPHQALGVEPFYAAAFDPQMYPKNLGDRQWKQLWEYFLKEYGKQTVKQKFVSRSLSDLRDEIWYNKQK